MTTPSETQKICKKCGGPGPFHRDKRRGGFRSECKACTTKANQAWAAANPERMKKLRKDWATANPERIRMRQIRQAYGITEEEYDALLERQSYVCAICHDPLERLSSRTHVDHCHQTGQVRGLLCRTCNIGIGHLRESPKLLRQAALYCEKAPLGTPW